MENVYWYSETCGDSVAEELGKHYRLTVTRSRTELAKALVERSPASCLVARVSGIDADFAGLLSSIGTSYPFLPVCLISPEESLEMPGMFRHFTDLGEPAEIAGRIHLHLSSVAVIDRRRKHRFDWPLLGYLSLDGESWKEHCLWSLGSGGAFLESGEASPPPGAEARLRIVFQNCELSTSCEVLDPRQVSSNLPAGFAVRFRSLGEASERLIDGIVNDALVRKLLASDSEPEIPALDGEELSIPGIDLL